MKPRIHFPLLAQVLCWLMLHLLLLGLAFFLFVRWQLGLGLDSLLSGAAGGRLAAFGDTVVSQTQSIDPPGRNREIHKLAHRYGIFAAIFEPHTASVFPKPVPANVLRRAREALPPPRPDPPRPPGPPGGPRPPNARPPAPERVDAHPDPQARGSEFNSSNAPRSRPVFLMRADHGDGYWAGVLVHFSMPRGMQRRPSLLLIRSDRLDGSGMFFDFQPWLWGGTAVLLLSLAFWTPVVWSTSRYIRRLTAAADLIASGKFHVSLPSRGNDELGNLGASIESMAARLDHLVAGQKRFLGDAAHELCAPLARIRTGLGVLQHQSHSPALPSIEADTEELAALVNEILDFSRVGQRRTSLTNLAIEPVVLDVLAREAGELQIDLSIPPNLTVESDSAQLTRAIANLVRNAARHAGPGATLAIHATASAEWVTLRFTDNGPGVPQSELARIFEPFYRVDRSRSRNTGGSGLGLAIVRSAIEACGGTVTAEIPPTGGFSVILTLPRSPKTAASP